MDRQFLIKVLESNEVKTFYIHYVEMHDLLQRYHFTMILDIGTFTASAEFVDETFNDMKILFRPEFGEMLKQNLIKQMKQVIDDNVEEDLKFDYILFKHFDISCYERRI